MIKINKDKCIGCGLCTELCGEIFEIQGDGKAGVKKQKKLPCVKNAIASCPVEAISE